MKIKSKFMIIMITCFALISCMTIISAADVPTDNQTHNPVINVQGTNNEPVMTNTEIKTKNPSNMHRNNQENDQFQNQQSKNNNMEQRSFDKTQQPEKTENNMAQQMPNHEQDQNNNPTNMTPKFNENNKPQDNNPIPEKPQQNDNNTKPNFPENNNQPENNRQTPDMTPEFKNNNTTQQQPTMQQPQDKTTNNDTKPEPQQNNQKPNNNTQEKPQNNQAQQNKEDKPVFQEKNDKEDKQPQNNDTSPKNKPQKDFNNKMPQTTNHNKQAFNNNHKPNTPREKISPKQHRDNKKPIKNNRPNPKQNPRKTDNKPDINNQINPTNNNRQNKPENNTMTPPQQKQTNQNNNKPDINNQINPTNNNKENKPENNTMTPPQQKQTNQDNNKPDMTNNNNDNTQTSSVTYQTSNDQLHVTGTAVTKTNTDYSVTSSETNTVLVENGGKLTLTNAKITKTGATTNSGNSEFLGTNAAILTTYKSTAYIKNSTIVTDATGANAIFATNTDNSHSGATVYVTDTTIDTYQDKSRGLDATYGGTIIADNVTINTRGGSCAALATDRGEGTVKVSNSVLNTGVDNGTGQGSPCIYSTGDITVINSTGTAHGAQIACIEGKNSINLVNSTLYCSGKGNRMENGNYIDQAGVFIYQSMSGDADVGTATFNSTNSKLSILSSSSYYKTAPMFYVTNTKGIVTITNTSLNFGSGVLIKVSSQNQWGTTGSNGGDLTFNAVNEALTGKIIVGDYSSLSLDLKNSTYKGAITTSSSATSSVTVEAGSTWTLTGDSYLTKLTNHGSIICGNYSLYVNGVKYTN